jgi:hypothetical protein
MPEDPEGYKNVLSKGRLICITSNALSKNILGVFKVIIFYYNCNCFDIN